MQNKAHIIGIAGIGMSATALLLKQAGWEVTGSDEGFYPPASEILPKHGIKVSTPHAAANIPPDANLLVVGKHAKLTSENPEVAAAEASGIPLQSYPEVLASLTQNRTNLVVAGSYGKSTTTALVAWALMVAKKSPGYFIGAVAKNLPLHAQLGTSKQFILEGDEYPSSNTDPSAKFLHYNAHSVLLTSALHDHVNIFPTQADYLKPFQTLIAALPKDGLLVACADEQHALALTQNAPCRVVTYGLSEAPPATPRPGYLATHIHYGETTHFTLTHNGKALGEFTTTQLGAHNIQNMVGAAALLLEHNLATIPQLQQAFATFAGVVRRMDKLTTRSPIPVYEGFGSSRDKAASAIAAMRLHFPNRRLIVVFEPHTFSWRNRATLGWYDNLFQPAAHTFLYPPPTHGATTHAQLSQADILAHLQAQNLAVTPLTTNAEQNLRTLTGFLQPHDVILLLTSGDLGGLPPLLIHHLESTAT